MTDRANLEHVNCNLCGSGENRKLFEKDGFTVVECRNCSLVYLNPMPKDDYIENLYDEDYYTGRGFDRYNELLNKHLRRDSKIISRWFARFKLIEFAYGRKGKILDMGCAFGDFLKIAKDNDWDTYGIEISSFPCESLVENFGKEHISRLPIDKGFDFEKSSFDVVTMTEVIEHLRDHDKAIKNAYSLLKEGGMFVVQTSDITSGKARRLCSSWKYILPPGHLYYFSKKTLRTLLEKNGFEIVKFFQGGETGSIKILKKLGLVKKETLKMNGFARALYRIILSAYKVASKLIGYDCMTFYATKQSNASD